MSNYNSNITDKEIRELLKRRILEQNEDDLLTKNLIEMEAKIAFANEPLLVPSLYREQELITKLNNKFSNNILGKWLLVGVGLVVIISGFLMIKNYFRPEGEMMDQPVSSAVFNGNVPQKFHQNQLSILDTSNGNVDRVIPFKSENKRLAVDAVIETADEKLVQDKSVSSMQYSIVKEKQTKEKILEPYSFIPTITPKEVIENEKYKNQMLKYLLDAVEDKKHLIRHIYSWAKIPKGSVSNRGEDVSVNEFYISTIEVTNKEYRTFVNDLLIQDKMEDYLKVLPDTSGRFLKGKTFFDPSNYFWQPKFDEYPIVNISREAATLYCQWLQTEVAKQNKDKTFQIDDVRLPFDTEWIYAAQGGTKDAIYPWQTGQINSGIQNAKGCFLCNFSTDASKFEIKQVDECSVKISDGTTTAGAMTKGEMITAPSYSYNPNNFGLYNMSGNVAEMVKQNKTNKPETKGGSWKSDCNHVKINGEDEYDGIIEASPFIGFRPVFTVKKIK